MPPRGVGTVPDVMNRLMTARRPVVLMMAAAAISLNGCVPSYVARLDHFRGAQLAGDYETARLYLSDDPRVWWEVKEGEGAPWVLGGGRWGAWDTHFRGSSTHGAWVVEDGGRRVSAVFEEINDYYRLLERPAQHHRQTYFFDARGRIEGMMVSDVDEPDGAPEGLGDAFGAWASANAPEEWAYLRPGGKIDPTGDRAERTRRLLNAWRATRGLEAIW